MKVDMDEVLLACPFCGGKAQLEETRGEDYESDNTDTRHEVVCTECVAVGPPGRTKERAAAWWNERSGGSEEAANALKYAADNLRTLADALSPSILTTCEAP